MKSAAWPGTPASARHHSFRLATVFGVQSVSFVKAAVTVALVVSPGLNALARTVVVEFNVNGVAYSGEASVGSLPSRV